MIYNQYNAVKEFIKVLGKGARVVADFNKGRHKVVETKEGDRYYCVYKREFYNKFGIIHKSFVDENTDYKGLGESLNIDSANTAITYHATTLVFIHPEKIYWIYSAQFRKFAMNNNLKNPTKTGEWRYSVPKEILKEWKE